MIRKMLLPFLLSVSLVLPAAQVQPNEIMPAVDKYFAVSKLFFKKHRGGALLGWFEKYHDPNRDAFGEYHIELHRGFRFEFIRGNVFKEDTLTSITITDPTIQLPLNIKIGDSKEKVKQLFGEPTSIKDNQDTFVYDCYMTGVTFKFSRDKLVEASAFYDYD